MTNELPETQLQESEGRARGPSAPQYVEQADGALGQCALPVTHDRN